MKSLTKRARIVIVLAFIFVPYLIGMNFSPIDFFLAKWFIGITSIVSVIGCYMIIMIVYRFIMKGELTQD